MIHLGKAVPRISKQFAFCLYILAIVFLPKGITFMAVTPDRLSAYGRRLLMCGRIFRLFSGIFLKKGFSEEIFSETGTLPCLIEITL